MIAPVMRPRAAAPAGLPAAGARRPARAEVGAVACWLSALRRRGSGDAGDRRPSPRRARTPRAGGARARAPTCARCTRREGVAWSEIGVLLTRSRGDWDVYLEALRDARIPFTRRGRSQLLPAARDRSRRRRWCAACSIPTTCSRWSPRCARPRSACPTRRWLPLFASGLPARVRARSRATTRRVWRRSRATIAGAAADAAGRRAGPRARRGLGARAAPRALAAIARAARELRPRRRRRLRRDAARLTLLEASEAARFLGAWRVANLERFFRELAARSRSTTSTCRGCCAACGATSERARAGGAAPARSGGGRGARDDDPPAKGLDFRHCYVAQLHKQSGRGRTDDPVELREQDGASEYRFSPGGGRLVDARLRAREGLPDRGRRRRAGEEPLRSGDARPRPAGAARDRGDAAGAGDLERAGTHAQLLAFRSGAPLDLAAEMAQARRERRDAAEDADGVRWVFPGLRSAPAPGASPAPEPPTLPSVEALVGRGRAPGRGARGRGAAHAASVPGGCVR